MIDSLPDAILEQVFDLVKSNSDRNSMSMVCKRWYEVERFSRKSVLIGNCYSVNPQMLISRFPRFRSLSLKGNPHFADFNWGGDVYPWIQAMSMSTASSSSSSSSSYININIDLEELRLKRMRVSDDCLHLISQSFPNFKSLILVNCQGFSTDGLASIASNCRFVRELELQDIEIEDRRGQWLSCFPDTCTSLVSLNFSCLKGQVNLCALERLVARCVNLRNLRVNEAVPLIALQKILVHAPHLVDLGAGSLLLNPDPHTYTKLINTFQNCTSSVRTFSGFLGVAPPCLPAFYILCSNLTSLNLTYAPRIYIGVLIKLIRHCTKLERLWILDTIEDRGLRVVASICKQLKELRVFPSNHIVGAGAGAGGVTEQGLVAISAGCPNLNSVVYFCQQMTNAALISVAKNSRNLVVFKLCTVNPSIADAVTMKPLDEGFGAIVQSCKGLRRLSLSGVLSDQVFLYIGMYGEELEMLSVGFVGESASGKGMMYVLNGCKKLKKLEIRESTFGDMELEADVGKYETMRSIWMSSCQVTLGACKRVAEKMARTLNVEIMLEDDDDDDDDDDRMKVKKMYLYRTLVGAREDAPHFVRTL